MGIAGNAASSPTLNTHPSLVTQPGPPHLTHPQTREKHTALTARASWVLAGTNKVGVYGATAAGGGIAVGATQVYEWGENVVKNNGNDFVYFVLFSLCNLRLADGKVPRFHYVIYVSLMARCPY